MFLYANHGKLWDLFSPAAGAVGQMVRLIENSSTSPENGGAEVTSLKNCSLSRDRQRAS